MEKFGATEEKALVAGLELIKRKKKKTYSSKLITLGQDCQRNCWEEQTKLGPKDDFLKIGEELF